MGGLTVWKSHIDIETEDIRKKAFCDIRANIRRENL
jgi:hypothetical protein